jgi:hypothetical protein
VLGVGKTMKRNEAIRLYAIDLLDPKHMDKVKVLENYYCGVIVETNEFFN